MMPLPFHTINWGEIKSDQYPGESGMATWKSVHYTGLRIRIVEYSNNYVADHWCRKGHIVYCLEGELISELHDGRTMKLSPGMSYVVSDNASVHRSHSPNGVKLLIIDGTFLQHKIERNPWKV